MERIPTYAKFMKDLLIKKRRIQEEETMEWDASCLKSQISKKFHTLCTIARLIVGKALLNLGASINLMPLSMLKRIGDVEVQPSRMTLQLANRSIKYPYGIEEDLLVKLDKFYFHVDFVIMDLEEDSKVPLILGRPFMKKTKVIIDVGNDKIKVRVLDKEIIFHMVGVMKHPVDQQKKGPLQDGCT
ncbi:uncharacterized protein LOC114188313 [Vigna unguiculata]|uniref:uncharacterized protein LOC114188313 n=1 Tax=Vigna unguiculata TaxID=3917 RepID=UPI0010171549|nr:uncharacterized protein LOC114188313 [Vigna unguiculata]